MHMIQILNPTYYRTDNKNNTFYSKRLTKKQSQTHLVNMYNNI